MGRLIDADALMRNVFLTKTLTQKDALADAIFDVVATLIDSAPTVEPQPQWTSVKDGMPKVGEVVLLRTTYPVMSNPITLGMLFQPPDGRGKPYWEWIQHSKSSRFTDNYPYATFICPKGEWVTHWKPLPAPPKEDADV